MIKSISIETPCKYGL